MKEYIEREAARDLMYHKQDSLTEYDLDSIPTADVVECKDLARVQVAYDKVGQALDAADRFYTQGYTDAMADHNLVERKRGRWLEIDGEVFECDMCHRIHTSYKYDFCPECGSDMREVEP